MVGITAMMMMMTTMMAAAEVAMTEKAIHKTTTLITREVMTAIDLTMAEEGITQAGSAPVLSGRDPTSVSTAIESFE
jgi:hypothetical protein